ncbi:hypothetical protein TWF481_002818 [Arthrobotrys musiformis]|uniref:Chromo domain-containing protein n=1 Tax=Arthrobotrys musiformis TaxID=47236 RepID=A0AAV9VTS4_9PEZI
MSHSNSYRYAEQPNNLPQSSGPIPKDISDRWKVVKTSYAEDSKKPHQTSATDGWGIGEQYDRARDQSRKPQARIATKYERGSIGARGDKITIDRMGGLLRAKRVPPPLWDRRGEDPLFIVPATPSPPLIPPPCLFPARAPTTIIAEAETISCVASVAPTPPPLSTIPTRGPTSVTSAADPAPLIGPPALSPLSPHSPSLAIPPIVRQDAPHGNTSKNPLSSLGTQISGQGVTHAEPSSIASGPQAAGPINRAPFIPRTPHPIHGNEDLPEGGIEEPSLTVSKLQASSLVGDMQVISRTPLPTGSTEDISKGEMEERSPLLAVEESSDGSAWVADASHTISSVSPENHYSTSNFPTSSGDGSPSLRPAQSSMSLSPILPQGMVRKSPPAMEPLVNSTPPKDSTVCASKSSEEYSSLTKKLAEKLDPYKHSPLGSDKSYLKHPTDIIELAPCSCYQHFGIYTSSNEDHSILSPASNCKSISENPEERLRMICPHASERQSTNEIPGSTKHMDRGDHQADNPCLNEKPGAEPITNRTSGLVARIIEGGVEPALEERPPLPHNLSMEEYSEILISLSHAPTKIINESQTHERHVTNQTACNKVDYLVTQAEHKDVASSSEAQPSTEELDHLEKEYEVERVEGYRVRRGREEYLVKWTGYDDRTWEPVGNLKNAPLALDEYIQRHTLRKRKREWPGNQAANRKLCRLEARYPAMTDALYPSLTGVALCRKS